jgi:flagellar hook assembly protein FlgD
MKLFRYIVALGLFILSIYQQADAQQNTGNAKDITEGSLTFTVRTLTNSTGYSPKHVLSIWIKDSLGNFIVSRKVMAASRKKHLVKWVASSNYNTTSATTGATLSAHQTHTITWDGKDYNNQSVTDGVYQVWVEYTSENSANGQPSGPSMSVLFHKGPVSEHLTPANLAYFQNIMLDWVPLGVGSKESSSPTHDISIFPNPFSKTTTIRFSLIIPSQVQAVIYDSSGKLINHLISESCDPGNYSFSWDGNAESGNRVKTGIYFLYIKINGRSAMHKFIVD